MWRFDGMSCELCACTLLFSSTVLAGVYPRNCGVHGFGGIYSRLLNGFLGDPAMFFDHSTLQLYQLVPIARRTRRWWVRLMGKFNTSNKRNQT